MHTFELWVGRVFDPKKNYLLIVPNGREKESIVRLSRIGIDNIKGIL